MNIDNIFNLFKSSEQEHETTTQVDMSEHPIVWMGMFKKLIINYKVFSKQMIEFFESSDPKLDTDDIKLAGGIMVFARAMSYLSKIDITNQMHRDCLILYSDEYFLKALSLSLSHFEDLEEYENCALLKKIQDVANPSSK
jgi:hypothetical protein